MSPTSCLGPGVSIADLPSPWSPRLLPLGRPNSQATSLGLHEGWTTPWFILLPLNSFRFFLFASPDCSYRSPRRAPAFSCRSTPNREACCHSVSPAPTFRASMPPCRRPAHRLFASIASNHRHSTWMNSPSRKSPSYWSCSPCFPSLASRAFAGPDHANLACILVTEQAPCTVDACLSADEHANLHIYIAHLPHTFARTGFSWFL